MAYKGSWSSFYRPWKCLLFTASLLSLLPTPAPGSWFLYMSIFNLFFSQDFFHNLMTHMAFMQAFSKKVTPSVLQKREKFWSGLVNDVRLLEQKASQYGIHLESLLKVMSQKKPTGTSWREGIVASALSTTVILCPVVVLPYFCWIATCSLCVSVNCFVFFPETPLEVGISIHYSDAGGTTWLCCSYFVVPGLTVEPL